jgi:acetyl esterase/lipase
MQRLLCLALIAAGFAQGQQRQDPPWLKEFVNKRIVYQVPGMKSVRVKKNLIYKRAGNEDLLMDVYSPTSSRTRRPAVLFVHGGRVPPNLLTTAKNWAVYVSFGELVAASGFVGVTFNHRFYTWESLADSQADVMDAVKYVRDNAATLGVDPERIVLWTVSAGGIFLSQPLQERPSYLKSIVAYYSQLDLQNARKSAPASVSDETLREFSPVYQLERSPGVAGSDTRPGGAGRVTTGAGGPSIFPPMFIARAGLDSPDLNDGLDRFVQAALKHNVSVEVLNHATGHHGFDIEDNNARSREILKRTIEFLKTHIDSN